MIRIFLQIMIKELRNILEKWMRLLTTTFILVKMEEKFFTAMGLLPSSKQQKKITYTVNFLIGLIIHHNRRNQISVYF